MGAPGRRGPVARQRHRAEARRRAADRAPPIGREQRRHRLAPPGDHRLLAGLAAGTLRGERVELLVEVAHLAQAGLGGPGLGDGAAPVGVDKADRHVQPAQQLTAEVVADRRETAPAARLDRLGPADVPGRVDRRQRARRNPVGHHEQAQRGLVGVADVARRADRVQAHLHVGLARTDPDVAAQQVAADHRLARAADRHLVELPGAQRADAGLPAPVIAGLGSRGLAVDGHADLLARRRPAPDGDGAVTLQDGVVVEEGREERLDLHLAPGRAHRDQQHA